MNEKKPTFRSSLRSSYSAAFSIFSKYWKDYEGTIALLTSPYFHAALALKVICYPLWTEAEWWEFSLAFLPSAIGFSLAAFAMILAFGNETFISVMVTRAKGRDKAAFQRVSNAFFHFLVVQFIAFVAALLCKAYYRPLEQWVVTLLEKLGINIDAYIRVTHCFWSIAFLLTAYSIMCGLTASVRVYRLSNSFIKVMNQPTPVTSEVGSDKRADAKVERTAQNN